MTLSQALRQSLRHVGVIAAAALLVTAVNLKLLLAMGSDAPYPPTDDNDRKKDKKKSNVIEQQEQKLAQEKFLRDYRAARDEILAGDYKAGIAAMHALGHDEHPDVVNYIGYANRKIGNYDQSKVWYEKALAADATHVRTWSYYGMWRCLS